MLAIRSLSAANINNIADKLAELEYGKKEVYQKPSKQEEQRNKEKATVLKRELTREDMLAIVKNEMGIMDQYKNDMNKDLKDSLYSLRPFILEENGPLLDEYLDLAKDTYIAGVAKGKNPIVPGLSKETALKLR
jgi:hypothetical protein